MNKKKFFRPVVLAVGVLALQSGRAQVSTANNSPASGDYVGCDGATLFPLEVRHNGNQPIQWFTDSIQRMQLWNSQASTINGFTGMRQNGFVGISPQPLFFSSSVGPFSRLHLTDSISDNPTNYVQQFGYRPWMRNGITMTGNADHQYIGQKGRELDYTDMIIHWSDNPGEFLKDRMRFLFTSGFNSAASGAESEEGLEFMRMWPNRYEDPHIGVGDFYAALCSL